MKNNLLEDVELVIFDLDGTLYEDTDHFDYYAEQLKQELPEEVQPLFSTEYKKMVSGNHPVTIGKVYDVVRDHILQVDAIHTTVVHAWTWDGEELNSETIQSLYPHPLQLDFDTMIAIGDGWWLPNVCAKHFGLQDTQTAYHKTKDFMATDQFKLTKIPGLREGLSHLKEKKDIVLLTNSTEDDVARLLKNLDLQGIFDSIITEARKPSLTKNHFSTLLKEKNIEPIKALSVGDNYINEIAPAIYLGMQTVFIDLYEFDYPEYSGLKVKSISEIIDDMISL